MTDETEKKEGIPVEEEHLDATEGESPKTPEELEKKLEEAAKKQEMPANPRAPGDMMDQLVARLPTGAEAIKASQLIKRRTVSFIFDGSAGAPGIFMDAEGNYLDVELWCQSLSTTDELDALEGVTQQIAAPYALAKHCLFAVEGKPIPPDMKEFIWEAIGPVGRQLCIMAMQSLGNVSESAMGKYQSSFTVR